jgi:hypothetical protein
MKGGESDDEIGKFANVLTLGDLRRDQSKVQLSKSPSFIIDYSG